MIARELELNNWAIKSIRYTFLDVERYLRHAPKLRITVFFSKAGETLFRREDAEGKLHGGHPIPTVHKEVVSKHMMDIATLDPMVFAKMQGAYDAVAELEHIRQSLISQLLREDPDFPEMWEPFINYARRELDDVHEKLSALYKACTGNVLADHRLR